MANNLANILAYTLMNIKYEHFIAFSIFGLVDEATKHNWRHWFFVAILFRACAQWSRIFALWNWTVWTENRLRKGLRCWLYCVIGSIITGSWGKKRFGGLNSVKLILSTAKINIFTFQKQFFFVLKSQIFVWISQSSQLKSFFSKSFFNSIRIGTTSLSCFAFKVIDNVPAGRAVFCLCLTGYLIWYNLWHTIWGIMRPIAIARLLTITTQKA